MNNYVARANIDHFLDLLHNHDVPAYNRSTITKLLIEEENKLSHDQEQLQFAETKAVVCRDRADRQRCLMDSFSHGSTEWQLAERLLVNFESLAQFVEGLCEQMRGRVNESPL